MSADGFYVCYGIRREVDSADSLTVEALELRQHDWQVAAKQGRLSFWWGTTINESKFVILVGRALGQFGWEGESQGKLSADQAAAIAVETNEKLRASGFMDEPAWHFHFVPDR